MFNMILSTTQTNERQRTNRRASMTFNLTPPMCIILVRLWLFYLRRVQVPVQKKSRGGPKFMQILKNQYVFNIIEPH